MSIVGVGKAQGGAFSEAAASEVVCPALVGVGGADIRTYGHASSGNVFGEHAKGTLSEALIVVAEEIRVSWTY